MNFEIILTPEELFFLGELMEAEYFEYSNLAAMDDVQKNYAMLHTAALDNLSRKKILRLSLRGAPRISPEVQALLKPVFFGKTVSALDVAAKDPRNELPSFRIHQMPGAATAVIRDKGSFTLRAAGASTPRELLENLALHLNFASLRPQTPDPRRISRIILLRRSTVGGSSRAQVFLEQGGILLREEEKGLAANISRSEFLALSESILKGV